jgi:valyl-tRNA synthetase
MNENAGAYAGLDRFEARKRVLADLEAQGFLPAGGAHQKPWATATAAKP